jgi:lipopolysaccharide export system ATP-binding protein
MSKLQAVELRKSYRGRKVVDDVFGDSAGRGSWAAGTERRREDHDVLHLGGLARPDYGRVLLDGEDITDLPMYLRARSGISYLPQEPSVFRKLTVEENLLAVLETLSLTPEQRRERVEELLAQMGLEACATAGRTFCPAASAGGLEIARSLVLSPSFVLLDEPFAGIDPLTVVDIQKIIADLSAAGIGVLVTDHNVRIPCRHRVAPTSSVDGKILAAGTPGAFRNDPKSAASIWEKFRLN